MSILIRILSFLFIIFIIYFILFHGKDIISFKKYNLEKDGLIVRKNILKKGEIVEWKNLCLKEKYKELQNNVQHPTTPQNSHFQNENLNK